MQFVPEEPIHPGDILRKDFLAEYDVSVERAASELGVPTSVLQEIVEGSGSIDAELALRLARYFETSPEFWLNLQRSFDLSVALKSAAGLEKIRPVRAA